MQRFSDYSPLGVLFAFIFICLNLMAYGVEEPNVHYQIERQCKLENYWACNWLVVIEAKEMLGGDE